MEIARFPWLLRATGALLVTTALLVAWVEGGGADARVAPPSPGSTPASEEGGTERAAGADVYEVKIRLVEALGDASIEAPNLTASQPYFRAHWRKLRGPWVHHAGVAGQLVTTIALRTSADAETPWAVSTQTGQTWSPDVRVWNMNEGTFDQREAIYAPTPATLSFRTTLPLQARIRFSPAVAMPLAATTLFEVTVVDAAGGEHLVAQTRIAPADARRWLDADADLGPWGGQRVELRLRTWTERPANDDKRWSAPPSPDVVGADAEPPERPVTPPMALALWGNPVIVARQPPRVPYNVLWVVVDALRPDVAAALHDAADDAAKLAAPRPPIDALLPVMPGLMPSIDRIATRGVFFTHAWSVGAWTRPGTLAMLTGERSSEVGIDATAWVQPAERVARYYASEPPLVPLLLRKNGVTTAAFVNNFFLAGYAVVGLDMGFERVTDHRYRTRDTALITYDALAWLEGHAGDRFLLFVNYNSPHEPYDPQKEMLARVPPPPAGPRDGQVRAYLAEAAKDDTAIGVLLEKLEGLGLAESTLVIVTSDHGETLSSAHEGFGMIGGDKMPMRFHHAAGNFEETTRIPLVMALPRVFEGGRAVSDRVRNIDIAPTVLELEGLDADARMSGRSLMALGRGRKESEPRVVVSEGRLSRAILWGKWRLIVHDAPEHPQALPDGGTAPLLEDELYDLDEDPGERRNVARSHGAVVSDLRARLPLSRGKSPVVDASPAVARGALPAVRFRFASAGRPHKVSGILTIGDPKHPASTVVDPAGIPGESLHVAGSRVAFDFAGSPDGLVGFDLRIDPPGAAITWKLLLDGAPWPDGATFAGPFGLPAVAAREGIATDEARDETYARALPLVDAKRELGVFVTRDAADRAAETAVDGPAVDGAGAKEMQRMLREWGYAHGSH